MSPQDTDRRAGEGAKDQKLIQVAQIGAPHGVRGLVKIRSFTEDPEGLLDYGPLCDQDGRRFAIELKGMVKGSLLCAIEGYDARESVEKLNGVKLFIPRDVLPVLEEEEFYQTDLLNLSVLDAAGETIGRIKSVQDFGAGELLEVAPLQGGKTWMLPFTREAVPVVSIAAGHVQISDMPGLLPGEGGEEGRPDDDD